MDLFDGARAEARQGDPYQIELQIARFEGAVAKLPQRSRVGYISDLDINTIQGLSTFLGAQYALAPRLLVDVAKTRDGDWVVGNFSKPLEYATFGLKFRLVMQTDLGNGVVLYKPSS